MPDQPRHIDVSWADDRYPPIPDEKVIGRIRIHRRENQVWPEDFDGDEWPESLEELDSEQERYEEERAAIAALADELRQLREGTDGD